MKTYYLYITVAFVTIFSMYTLLSEEDDEIALLQQEVPSHPIAPFKSYITGVGIVQASSENIFIGSPIIRIVEKVLVSVGMEVKKGDPLLKFENRDLESDLLIKQVAYDIALAKIAKLKALPQPEDITSAEAALRSAQIDTRQAKTELDRALSVEDRRAISQEEVDKRSFHFEQAQANENKTQLNLDKIKAGTWQPDLNIAHLEAEQAKANLEKSKTDIERTIIRSPIDARILQIKIHEGELPAMDSSRNPMMIIGNTKEKYLQVSINQYNAPSFKSDAPAIAFLQGDNRTQFPLEFIRLEPYMVNKQNLTNEISEKVDTKVLNVIYRFKDQVEDLFIGQQMDVFIETEFAP